MKLFYYCKDLLKYLVKAVISIVKLKVKLAYNQIENNNCFGGKV
jgi:hypothetical protein